VLLLKILSAAITLTAFSLLACCLCGATYLPEPPRLNTNDHMAYLEITDGCFRPNDPLKREELIKMIESLLVIKTNETATLFLDLKESEITRAAFAATLRRLFPNEPTASDVSSFKDVPEDSPYRDAIAFATGKGWISGYPNGNFLPNQLITRAETAVVMNRVLGRTADKEAVQNGADIRILLDVPQSHWAFSPVLEATIAHTYEKNDQGGERWLSWNKETTGLSSGLHLYEGELYYINEAGQIVRSVTIGDRQFDQNGRYTTTNAELDRFLTQVIVKHTKKNAPIWEKRRALFVHMRDSYAYRKRPLVSKDDPDWVNRVGLKFFQDGVGNCYSFAAAYGLLLRKIGYDVDFIVGEVTYYRNRAKSAHGWVEITTDEGVHIDDPEFEMSHRNSNFYNFTYETAPAFYRK
jgi:hypothetical protein